MEDHSSCNNNVSEEVDMPMNECAGEENNLAIEDLDTRSLIEIVDCKGAFTTEEIFPSRDDLITWAKNIGRENGYVVVIIRSETGGPGRRTFVILGCEKSGKRRRYISKASKERKGSGSKKCECPFKLKGRPLKNGEGWMVKVLCGSHNHPRAKSLVGHPYAGRLSSEEKSMLADLTVNLVKPKSILLTLKDHNKNNVSTIKQIYNARHKFRLNQKGSRTQMQNLMKLLEDADYLHWHRMDENSDVVRDIFWTHPDAIDLLNAFHVVLIIDNTYKTNKYHLPLLEIVGVTSTELTFSVAFAYMESERADNYIWALQMTRNLIRRRDALPQVIVTDRDTTLMNAVQCVFPSSTHLLCRSHINKNVKAKCKMLVNRREEWESIMSSWEIIVDSPDEAEFEKRWIAFQNVYARFPAFVEYVRDTWLILYKEKFVSAWIDKVMHLGNTTINRAEGAHEKLKNMLQNSTGDFCSCWDDINDLITLQHNEIKSSFERSIITVEGGPNTNFFAKLQGFVSRSAMKHILAEYDRVKYVGVDRSLCGCSLRITHGLPCAHELASYDRMGYAIPLHVVHPHWRRLNFGEKGITKYPCEDMCIYHEMEAIWQQFQESDTSGKIAIKNKVHEIAYSGTTSISPLVENVGMKSIMNGSDVNFQKSIEFDPSSSENVDSLHDSTSSSTHSSIEEIECRIVSSMLEHFPREIHEYIEDVIDVKADGNCGYRAVAALLGKGEESWAQIRLDLIRELKTWHEDYVQIFGSKERVQELVNSLYINDLSFAPYDKWMTIPDMGYVIASRYNVVLVYLSMSGSMTFFPLRGPPPSLANRRIISIGYLPNSHFVQVFLKRGSPVPPVALQWQQYCYADAREWEAPYVSRMQAFESLFPCKVKEHVTSQV